MGYERPGEIILSQTEDGQTRIDVRLVGETVWLSAGQIADPFQRDKSTISRQIQNVFDEGELKAESVVALFATTAADGKIYQVEHYSFWRKVLEIHATSIDYDPRAEASQEFFATVQNKMHWAPSTAGPPPS